jgi:predicted aldo/keto reductase-like oxidoreductase
VDKCPQQIDIPEVLESVVKDFEGPGFSERVAMAKQLFKQI